MANLNLIPETKHGGRSIPRTVPQNTFLIFAVVLFLATASLWGGMTIWRDTLESEIEAIGSDVEKLESDIRSAGDAELRLRSLNQKLVSLETLLDQHPYPTNFFDFFEGITHPQVRYSHFSLNVLKREAALSGTAASYGILAQQLAAINKSGLAAFSNLTNIGLAQEGGVSFGITLLVNQNVFKKGL